MFNNTILELTKCIIKPISWVITQNPKSLTYSLEFTYVDPERNEFATVFTSRGDIKLYASVKAILHDLRKITPDPCIKFYLA